MSWSGVQETLVSATAGEKKKGSRKSSKPQKESKGKKKPQQQADGSPAASPEVNQQTEAQQKFYHPRTEGIIERIMARKNQPVVRDSPPPPVEGARSGEKATPKKEEPVVEEPKTPPIKTVPAPAAPPAPAPPARVKLPGMPR